MALLCDDTFMARLAGRIARLYVSAQAARITPQAFSNICWLQSLTHLVLGDVACGEAGVLEAVTPDISRLTNLQVRSQRPGATSFITFKRRCQGWSTTG